MNKTKFLAFFLPQFHPIPENDQWWGKGFTEWTNVSQARPRFHGHYQPHIPADLGFYDLRLAETRLEQAKLAAENGIYGFCYYHYWFNGHKLLERPIEDILKSQDPSFPFCLCWANETWSRTWSGEDRYILIKQEHSREDDVQHFGYLLSFFTDKRYICVDGKPMFIVYRPDLIADVEGTLILWRQMAFDAGLPGLHLVAVYNNFSLMDEQGFIDKGFDAVIEFQPHKRYIPKQVLALRVINKLKNMANECYRKLFKTHEVFFVTTHRHSYQKLKNKAIQGLQANQSKSIKIYPSVIPSWDNSARRKDGSRVIQNTDPKLFGEWLQHAATSVAEYQDDNFVFINAWNEWAEGAHLEPDLRCGDGFLKEVRKLTTQ